MRAVRYPARVTIEENGRYRLGGMVRVVMLGRLEPDDGTRYRYEIAFGPHWTEGEQADLFIECNRHIARALVLLRDEMRRVKRNKPDGC